MTSPLTLLYFGMAVEDLYSLLKRTGPALTTELIERMVSDGASAAAARQRVARGLNEGAESIKRLAGLRFQYNARFVYRDDQYGDRRFWDALERAFQRYAPSYWHAVAGLKARGGCVPKSLFATVTGAPLARQRQLSPKLLLERLAAIQLVDEFTDESDVDYVRFKPHHYSPEPLQVVRARLLAEKIALEGIRNWIRRIGFGSYEQVRIRDEKIAPEVSSVQWDLSAPSYMRPLVSRVSSGVRPGFVVLDINLRDMLDEHAVGIVVRKHDIASAPIKVAPIMPFLIADGFTADGFGLAKQKGILATTIAHLLGEEVAKALRDLIALLTDMGATAAVNPDHLERVFSTLSRIQGTSDNLRGPLLELTVAYLVKEIEGGSVEVGRRVTDMHGRSAEIDVILMRPDGGDVLAIECKAKSPGTRLTLEVVQHWLLDRVPVMADAMRYQSRFFNSEVQFELWTNGPMEPDALSWLTANRSVHSGVQIAWRDGAGMKEYARKAKSTAITKILNEHFFRHPLVAAARRGSANARVRPE